MRNSGEGSGVLTILLVVFLMLKLAGVVAWSWWWVLGPIWMPLAIAVVLMVCVGIAKVLP